MTLLSTLGYFPNKIKNIIPAKFIEAKKISVVIPVKNNQIGIDRFLSTFLFVTPVNFFPREIVIVDNNSEPPIEIKVPYPFVVILKKCTRIGPAAARNVGVAASTGDWILFTDSDCIPTPMTIRGYLRSENSVIGYAGGIDVVSDNILSRYYKSQETLIPPEAKYSNSVRPDYLVTANCLVSKAAINEIGGFDEEFKQAGGEDIDLAFRLLEIGDIDYCFASVTRHEFDDGVKGFVKRFIRYGRGNKQLEKKFNLNLRPKFFLPQSYKGVNILLAQLQFLSMLVGYMKGGLR
jgi:glycosyltransferase involved in cell wall biosynthesis